jgi:hypothetical protein
MVMGSMRKALDRLVVDLVNDVKCVLVDFLITPDLSPLIRSCTGRRLFSGDLTTRLASPRKKALRLNCSLPWLLHRLLFVLLRFDFTGPSTLFSPPPAAATAEANAITVAFSPLRIRRNMVPGLVDRWGKVAVAVAVGEVGLTIIIVWSLLLLRSKKR